MGGKSCKLCQLAVPEAVAVTRKVDFILEIRIMEAVFEKTAVW